MWERSQVGGRPCDAAYFPLLTQVSNGYIPLSKRIGDEKTARGEKTRMVPRKERLITSDSKDQKVRELSLPPHCHHVIIVICTITCHHTL